MQAFVPTRLTDMGPVDGDQVPRIQFETNLRGQKIDYIALSYCWGTRHARALQDNNTEYRGPLQGRVFHRNCPRTIKDALIFTRALGLRYIWIDVLCILQDSEPDWTTGSRRTGLVYSSAYCTLAASVSRDTHSRSSLIQLYKYVR
jgi:hypothetical protein